jgi:hypothetical protein
MFAPLFFFFHCSPLTNRYHLHPIDPQAIIFYVRFVTFMTRFQVASKPNKLNDDRNNSFEDTVPEIDRKTVHISGYFLS